MAMLSVEQVMVEMESITMAQRNPNLTPTECVQRVLDVLDAANRLYVERQAKERGAKQGKQGVSSQELEFKPIY